MNLLARQPLCLATIAVAPLLTLAAPSWLSIAGVPPAWGVLWLLPWALVDGPISGALAGLVLGLLLDSLHPGPASEIPPLVFLGWWWGSIGLRPLPLERSFSLGLLAMIGSALVGIWLIAQFALSHPDQVFLVLRGLQPVNSPRGWTPPVIGLAGLHILGAQILITGLLAPMLCSLQLLYWRHQGVSQR